MFFISQGDCVVNIKDHNLKECQVHALLIEGDHFGEISLVYGCKRTATVISRNYNTMAYFRKDLFMQFKFEYPEFF
jgi:CRP-like cAMP-binding protein